MTQVAGLAIAVSTADCGPVLLADADARVIGVAHAGWRGALTGVIEATIAAMEELARHDRTSARRSGPMIRQPNYEVGPDLVTRFTSADPESAQYFAPGTRQTTLSSISRATSWRGSRRAGIGGYDDLGLCTYADAGCFFSFRRTTHRGEPDYGRHLSAIVLQ